MGAALVVYFGLLLPLDGRASVNMAITIFWLVGITNAVNLLDNMDGLAAGISAIAAVFLAVSFLANGQPTEAVMLARLRRRARRLPGLQLEPGVDLHGRLRVDVRRLLPRQRRRCSAASGGRGAQLLVVLAVPVLILFIPIFDTTLVTVLRKLSGRAASQGGRDHTSHRLVALGLSERRAVWMLYGVRGRSRGCWR